MSKSHLKAIAQQAKFVFRPLLCEFIQLAKSKQIPFLVFSAGLGDVIEEILKSTGYWIDDMEIVSNRMEFDDDGYCVGFHEPLIHVFNKNEASIFKGDHADKIKSKSNVILIGDSLGDVKMADGMKHEVKLTIGLLNHDHHSLIDKYLSTFDIVLCNDSSFEFLLKLINALGKSD